jgi:hypothetical protein
MPLPRDLPCGGGFQEPLDGGKSLLAGRADFDRDCKLCKNGREGSWLGGQTATQRFGLPSSAPALLPFLLPN